MLNEFLSVQLHVLTVHTHSRRKIFYDLAYIDPGTDRLMNQSSPMHLGMGGNVSLPQSSLI